jgi:hypothetical protein
VMHKPLWGSEMRGTAAIARLLHGGLFRLLHHCKLSTRVTPNCEHHQGHLSHIVAACLPQFELQEIAIFVNGNPKFISVGCFKLNSPIAYRAAWMMRDSLTNDRGRYVEPENECSICRNLLATGGMG